MEVMSESVSDEPPPDDTRSNAFDSLAKKNENAKLANSVLDNDNSSADIFSCYDNSVLQTETNLKGQVVDNMSLNNEEADQGSFDKMEEGDEEDEDDEKLLNTIRITVSPDDYSTCTGSYRAWSTNVDLGPHRTDIPIPEEDENVLNYYEALQYTLYETGCPETIDRTSQPRTVSKGASSITILSSPVECMAILMEGGRRCPGDMLLILSSSWLSKKKSETKQSLYSLYVHKAIAFAEAGQTYLETYSPPRRTTYFVNFFTKACTNGARNDGEAVEALLDCPTSSSLKLTALVDDKVWTRCVMAKVGMAFPETLAFVYDSDLMYPNQDVPEIRVVRVDEQKTDLNLIVYTRVSDFLALCADNDIPKIVVKPSGIMWHGSSGVTFHHTADHDEVISVVLELMTLIQKGDAILVEAFQETIKPENTEKLPKWACAEDNAVRLRTTVCRAHDDTPKTTNVNCGIANLSEPVNGDNTVCQSLKTTLMGFGITDETEVENFEKEVKEKSAAVLDSIMSYENDLSTTERGGLHAQTDVIGIDFVITRRRDVLTPVGIEVNSHDCTINCQIYENLYPQEKGLSVRPWIETMITRSQKFLLVGKKILVIGAGSYGKAFVWPAAQDMGVQVVLVESDPNHFAVEEVAEFIHYDFMDHTQDDKHAVKIYKLLKQNKIKVDGCVTFWEDCVPLTAIMCQLLNLTGSGESGAKNAKNKSSTFAVLRKKTADIPHFPRTYLYTSWFTPLRCKADVENVKKIRKFPLVLKLEYGSSAVGVTLVKNAEELEEKYLEIRSSMQDEKDYFGIGLGHGNTLMVMEYIGGTEHDVDIIIFQRKLVAAFISDNGPTRGKTFTETAACMPSVLPADKQRQLIIAAYQCCTEIGLENGVFNVEWKMMPTGPKLVEINGRMGGFYLRDWIRKLYGVDLLMCAFLVSCGIKPYVADRSPRGQMMGFMCIPSLHSHILNDPETLSRRQELEAAGKLHFNQFDQHAEVGISGYEEPFANIGVMEKDVPTAKQRLLELADEFDITRPNYDVAEFLSDFFVVSPS
ncbi:hypothetical protein CHS0354_024783 [Potamilus streckersoni]|uniref:ATP-grasp domain-containing protein n=1 Tax=Potamilus streckersoni TaxID=2493646 RepID=A0AAE0T2K1_9BIVA|nr:hypothetical protein CHS0354_024783 [Potamilus streckersoni]